MSHRTRAYIMLLLVVLIWGVAGPVIKFTLGTFNPIPFLTLRFLVTSLVLIPLLFFTERNAITKLHNLDTKDWIIFVLACLVGSTGQLLPLFIGYDLTTAIDGSLITATSPILTSVISFIFLKDQITKREKLGIFIAFTGSVLIIGQPLWQTGNIFSGNLLGNILVAFGTAMWSVYVVLSKKLLRHNLSPLLITTANFFVGFISMSLLTFFTISKDELFNVVNLPISGWLGVLFMGLISGGLSYFLYQKAQKSIESSEADVFLYLTPLVSTPLGYFWLHEPITFSFLVGSGIIAIGVWISSQRGKHLV